MYKSKLGLIISGLLINGALFTIAKSYAEVIVNTDTGTSNLDTIDNTYNITESLGRTEGANLFHSFDTFNIDQSETANFLAGTGIDNIITRVTGGETSTINGTIKAPTNFFLLNTSGIIFGANANLDINGTFHASTADYIEFGDNEILETNAPVDATLYSAPPSAFGFTSSNPAAITVTGATLNNNGYDLSLIAGDITINQGAQIQTDNARIQLASMGSAGVASTDTSSMNMDVNMGGININQDSSIDSGGGKIVLRSGKLVMQESRISSDAVSDDSQGIDIVSAGSMDMTDATISSATDSEFGGGDIRITAHDLSLNSLDMTGSAIITNTSGSGAGADIRINARNIALHNGSKISANTDGTADGGDIHIRDNESLEVSSQAKIETTAGHFDSGKSGDIHIDTSNITMTGVVNSANYDFANFTGIRSGNALLAGSKSGDIDITANSITMDHNARIQTTSHNVLSGAGLESGSILIKSDTLHVKNGSGIRTASNGVAGSINIYSKELIVTGASENVHTVNRRYVKSGILRQGDGEKPLNIRSSYVEFSDGAYISSESKFPGSLASGDINIWADTVNIEGFNQRIYQLDTANGISEENALAAARTQVNASSDTNNDVEDRKSGNINIAAYDIQIHNKGALIANVNANSDLSGNSEIGSIILNSQRFFMNDGYISAQSSHTHGGTVTIDSSQSAIITNSTIYGAASGAGNGGNINLSSAFLYLNNDTLSASAEGGNGGNITISAREAIVTENNIFNVTSEQSTSGDVTITTSTDSIELNKETVYDTDQKLVFGSNCESQNKSGSSLALLPFAIHDTSISVTGVYVSRTAAKEIPEAFLTDSTAVATIPESTQFNCG